LAWSAPPGYSKHHTGYVIDLALPGQDHNAFGRSAAYQWLIADNYLVLKSFGFVPSYPEEGPPQGPNPEAWEYAFVGGAAFRCWERILIGDVVTHLGGPPSCPD
jgi:D-alanyl-D-alanine carboxypeptidase